MATLRKANAYSKRKVVPNTRISKRRQKSYVKTVPPQKIVKFTMGGEGSSELLRKGKLPHHLNVVSTEKVQIRSNALEACRQFLNKKVDRALSGQYLFRIIPFPHHIQRENKMITGAGADRMQTGMQLAFGKSAGKAAIMHEGESIFTFDLPNENAVRLAREAVKQVKPKLPGKIRIEYSYNK